ncbi:hypothetical protein LINPERHAP1_LOCUS42542, partial [Linum perenne]
SKPRDQTAPTDFDRNKVNQIHNTTSSPTNLRKKEAKQPKQSKAKQRPFLSLPANHKQEPANHHTQNKAKKSSLYKNSFSSTPPFFHLFLISQFSLLSSSSKQCRPSQMLPSPSLPSPPLLSGMATRSLGSVQSHSPLVEDRFLPSVCDAAFKSAVRRQSQRL